jgi:hypothetical protein
VKQQASQILFDAVTDKPMRTVFSSISLGCEWFTYGWNDVFGFTMNSSLFSQEYFHADIMKRIHALLDSAVVPSASSSSEFLSLTSLYHSFYFF